jgi:hypothetical protein
MCQIWWIYIYIYIYNEYIHIEHPIPKKFKEEKGQNLLKSSYEITIINQLNQICGKGHNIFRGEKVLKKRVF